MTALLTRHRQLLRPRWTILGLPCARSLPDPVGNGTVPLAGFRVTPLPGSAAEAEDREAEQAARQALPRIARVSRYRLKHDPGEDLSWEPIQ